MVAKRKPIGHALADHNLDPPDDEVTCRTCDGEGKDVDTDSDDRPFTITCGTCGGSGSVDAGEYDDDSPTCENCGEPCDVIPLDNAIEFPAAHCNNGNAGTHKPASFGQPVSDCCEADVLNYEGGE